MSGRALVEVTRACDGACVTCPQAGLEPSGPRAVTDVEAELGALDLGLGVTFVGGEPLLHPDLARLVAAAARRAPRVGVQTHAGHADPETLRALADAGLTDVHLSLHGETAAVHDYHTDRPGSFGRVLGAMVAARAVGLSVYVSTVVTRSNARNLPALARLLAARGADAWCMHVPRARGRAATAFDRVYPRLGLALPFALFSLEVAATTRLPAHLRGAPLCLLGPLATRAIPSPPRAHGDPCAACPARPTCPGVEPEYLARFSADELSPREPLAAAPDPGVFVGEGAVAPPTERQMPPSPARARVALPVLGKVRPAHAEVPRTAEKRSGDALRVLFGDLYRGAPKGDD